MDDGLPSRTWLRHAALAAAVTVALLAAPASASALTATTKAPTQVTQTSATIQGYVQPALLFSSYWYFEFGATTAYGIQSQSVPFYSSGIAQAAASGLEPGTTYHYRVVVKRSGSTVRGADQAFTTLPPDAPPPPDPAPDSGGGLDDTLGGLPTDTLPGTPPPVTTTTGPAPLPTDTSTGTGSGQGTRPGTGTGTGSPSPSGDPTGTDPEPAGALVGEGARPVLGTTVGAAPKTGSILVRQPGETRFERLEDGAAIPVGSTVDSRRGSVNVVTAVGDEGDVQTATFRGAVFKVRQRRGGGGLTDIALRGGDFSGCATRGRTGVSAARGRTEASAARRRHRRRPVRRLWGRDHHGRFRTHGRGAIATVRGTTWTVADYCNGTRTRVVHGAVAVRDRRRHRTVLVHAGHSYFARTR